MKKIQRISLWTILLFIISSGILDGYLTLWHHQRFPFVELNPLAKIILSDSYAIFLFKILLVISSVSAAIYVYLKYPPKGRFLFRILFIISALLVFYWIVYILELVDSFR